MSRPYFETRVVKVKKEEKPKVKCEHNYLIQIEDMPLRLWECANCKTCFTHPPKNYKLVKGNVYEKRKEGNWVNGENLDKIKFPCFCSFKIPSDKIRYGELDFIPFDVKGFYRLRELQQVKKEQVTLKEFTRGNLGDIVKYYDIHILKGKIIIFEEVKH